MRRTAVDAMKLLYFYLTVLPKDRVRVFDDRIEKLPEINSDIIVAQQNFFYQENYMVSKSSKKIVTNRRISFHVLQRRRIIL